MNNQCVNFQCLEIEYWILEFYTAEFDDIPLLVDFANFN